MTLRRRLTTLLLATAPGLFGCGGKEPKESGVPAEIGAAFVAGGRTAPPTDPSLARLVPSDALAVLYAPSISDLETKIRALVGAIDPDAGKEMDFDKILKNVVGPAFEQLDRSGPIAVALSPGTGERAEPSPTFVVAVKDGATAKAAFGEPRPHRPAPVVLGRFLALSTSADFAPGDAPNRLLDGLPAGDVSVRLDLARLVATYQKQIDQTLGQVAGRADESAAPDPLVTSGRSPSAQMVMKSYMAAVTDFLGKSERLDLGVRLDAGMVNLDVTFTAKEGSSLGKRVGTSADLAALAACLPTDYPIAGLLSVRFEDLMDAWSSLIESSLASMPEESRGAFRKMIAQSKELYALLGDGMAMGMNIGASGIEGVCAVNAKDPKAFLAKWEEMLNGGGFKDTTGRMGATVEEMPVTTSSGVEVRGVRMKFDWEKLASANGGARGDSNVIGSMQRTMDSLFGKDGFRIRSAIVGNRVLSVIGGDDDLVAKAIAAAKDPAAKAPPGLAGALSQSGQKPSFLVRVELRAAIAGIMDLVNAIRPPVAAGRKSDGLQVPSGAAIPLVVFGATQGRVFRGGLSVDVGAVGRLIGAMSGPIRRRAQIAKSIDNVRTMILYFTGSGVGLEKPWPGYSGKRFALWLVATNKIERSDPRQLDMLFSPGDHERSLAKAGGLTGYEALTLAALKDPSTDVSALTSYAGRRNSEKEHYLSATEQQNNAPILADLSFPGGVILGYVSGAVRWVTSEELGLPPDQPIVVGDASPNEMLRHFSDR